MAFWNEPAELDLFLRDFGVTCDLGAAFSPREITVIFDNEYEALALESGQIASRIPRILAKASDVEDLAKGMEVTIDDVDYKVIGLEPDGTGLTAVVLSKD